VIAGTFAGVNEFGAGFCEAQKFFVHEGVIDDDVSAREQLSPTNSQETGVTGTGADQINNTFFH
jgi:hypothetical protein